MTRRQLLVPACVLFFSSGAAGLAYEVIWFKRFAHVWGSSAFAAASVLASFLLGLGLGAGFIGRLADRVKSPLRWYAVAELGIAALALAVPYGLKGLEALSPALYPLLADRPLAGSLARALLTFLVIGPPCFLMGGTFPLLVKEFTPEGGTLRASAGILYAMNTLGGAAGAYAAGFHLLPALGLARANLAAALVNLAAGIAALLLAGSRSGALSTAPAAVLPDLPETGAAPARFLDRAHARRLVLTAAFLAGAASLALQIAWTRELSLILGGSTYAFSAVLAIVLAGIGLGSIVAHAWILRMRDPWRIQALVAMALIATALGGQLLLEPLARIAGAMRNFRADPWWNAALCAAAAAVLELLPSMAMGILFPLYATLDARSRADAGRTAGDVTAWNTAGTLLGALGGALVLLPALGLAGTVAAGLGLYTLAAILLFPAEGRKGKLALAGLALGGSGLAAIAARGGDPTQLNLGFYVYGLPPAAGLARVQLLHLEEGVSANIAVVRHVDGKLSLRVNGKVDASDGGDMPTQLGLAYFPRFVHPDARDVLVIGFGSGTTAGASLLFPEAVVACAEIEPAVVEASSHFRHVNHEPRKEGHRFRVLLDDGRHHLQGSRAAYDLILSEPSNPWMAGVANLFTREFYQAARERLRPGGVLAQWIQTYAFDPADYAMVVRTVLQVFPHGALVHIAGTDTVLLASESPLEPRKETLDRAQARVDALPAVKADLERHFDSTDVRSLFLQHRVLGAEGLRRLLAADGRDAVHTDHNLRLEFDAPFRLFDESADAGAVLKKIYSAADTNAIPEVWERWGCTRAQIPALREVLDRLAKRDAWEPARSLLEFALRLEPEDPYFLGAKFMSDMPEDEEAWDQGFARVLARSPEEGARIGVWLHANKDFARAVRAWKKLLAEHPQAATLWVNLASSQEANGEGEEARSALEKARALDPFSTFVRSRAAAEGEDPERE